MTDEKLTGVLRSKIPALVGGTIATVLVTIFSSYLGAKATLIGLALTTLVSGLLSTVSEHTVKLTAERARLRWHGYQVRDPYASLYRTTHKRNVPFKLIAASVGVIGLASLGTITVVEAAAGKPISDVVKGTKGSGFTLNGNTPSPTTSMVQQPIRHHTRPSVSYSTVPGTTPTPNPTAPTPTVTFTPSLTPTVTPSPLPSATTTPTTTQTGM
jgi:hypothetical protein